MTEFWVIVRREVRGPITTTAYLRDEGSDFNPKYASFTPIFNNTLFFPSEGIAKKVLSQLSGMGCVIWHIVELKDA